MKNSFKKVILFSLVFSCILFSNCVFAKEKYRIVLYYADWNVYSSQAIETLSQIAANSNQKISFDKINVDDKNAFVQMKSLGVMPTNAIPYYFVLTKNNKVVYGSTYNNEDVKTLNETIQKRLND